MDSKIPWDHYDIDKHFYPNEEYQISRVALDETTGKEDIIHYSLSENEGIPHYYDPLIYGYYQEL